MALKPFSGELDKEPVLKPFDGRLDGESPKRTILGTAADVGVSALKGSVGLVQSGVGLADTATGGHIGKAIEDYTPVQLKKTQAELDTWYSDAQKAANQKVSDAKGFGGKLSALVDNPSVAFHGALESAPSMLGAAGIGRGAAAIAPKILGGAANAWKAAAVGEGAYSAGSLAEGMREQSKDGLLTPGQQGAAVLGGLGTAAIGGASGKLQKKLGWDDVEASLVNKAAIGASKKGMPTRMAQGAASEGAFEEMPQSMWEKGAENLGAGRPYTEGMAEAGAEGLAVGGLMGAGGGTVQHRMAKNDVDMDTYRKEVEAEYQRNITDPVRKKELEAEMVARGWMQQPGSTQSDQDLLQIGFTPTGQPITDPRKPWAGGSTFDTGADDGQAGNAIDGRAVSGDVIAPLSMSEIDVLNGPPVIEGEIVPDRPALPAPLKALPAPADLAGKALGDNFAMADGPLTTGDTKMGPAAQSAGLEFRNGNELLATDKTGSLDVPSVASSEQIQQAAYDRVMTTMTKTLSGQMLTEQEQAQLKHDLNVMGSLQKLNKLAPKPVDAGVQAPAGEITPAGYKPASDKGVPTSEYTAQANKPFKNAPKQAPVAGAGVEGMLTNLKEGDSSWQKADSQQANQTLSQSNQQAKEPQQSPVASPSAAKTKAPAKKAAKSKSAGVPATQAASSNQSLTEETKPLQPAADEYAGKTDAELEKLADVKESFGLKDEADAIRARIGSTKAASAPSGATMPETPLQPAKPTLISEGIKKQKAKKAAAPAAVETPTHEVMTEGGDKVSVQAKDKATAKKMVQLAEAMDAIPQLKKDIQKAKDKNRDADYIADLESYLADARKTVQKLKGQGVEAPTNWGKGEARYEAEMSNIDDTTVNTTKWSAPDAATNESESETDKKEPPTFEEYARGVAIETVMKRQAIRSMATNAAPGVNIWRNVAEMNKERGTDVKVGGEGFYSSDDGSIHFFTDDIKGKDLATAASRAAYVARHELKHRGFVAIFGDKMNPMLDAVYNQHKDRVDAYVNGLNPFRVEAKLAPLDLTAEAGQREGTEEWLASHTDPAYAGASALTKAMVGSNSIRRLTSAARNWLRMAGLNLKWSDQDILSMAKQAFKAGRDTKAKVGGIDKTTKKSHSTNVNRFSLNAQTNKPGGYAGISANTRDALEKSVATYMPQVEAMLDSGKLDLYHGTGNDTPNVSADGYFDARQFSGTNEGGAALGAGTYLATTPETGMFYAAAYTNGVETYFLNTRVNPRAQGKSVLRFDVPLNKQTKRVQDAIRAAGFAVDDTTGTVFYNQTAPKAGGEWALNDILSKHGIIGTAAPAGWAGGHLSSNEAVVRAADNGELNYAIFNDREHIEIRSRTVMKADAKGQWKPVDSTLYRTGNMSTEAAPGLDSGYGYADAYQQSPLKVRDEFDDRTLAAKRKFILNAMDVLGLKDRGLLRGYGLWKGQTNKADQDLIRHELEIDEKGKPVFKAEYEQQLRTLLALAGMVTHQDGEGYHVPVYESTGEFDNAIEFDFGGQLTRDEFQKFGAELTKIFGDAAPIAVPTDNGIRVVDWSEGDFKTFKLAISDAVEAAGLKTKATGAMDFYSPSGLMHHSGFQEGVGYGTSYREQIAVLGKTGSAAKTSGTRRSDLQRAGEAFYHEAYQIRREFAERHWGLSRNATQQEREALIGQDPAAFAQELADTLGGQTDAAYIADRANGVGLKVMEDPVKGLTNIKNMVYRDDVGRVAEAIEQVQQGNFEAVDKIKHLIAKTKLGTDMKAYEALRKPDGTVYDLNPPRRFSVGTEVQDDRTGQGRNTNIQPPAEGLDGESGAEGANQQGQSQAAGAGTGAVNIGDTGLRRDVAQDRVRLSVADQGFTEWTEGLPLRVELPELFTRGVGIGRNEWRETDPDILGERYKDFGPGVYLMFHGPKWQHKFNKFATKANDGDGRDSRGNRSVFVSPNAEWAGSYRFMQFDGAEEVAAQLKYYADKVAQVRESGGSEAEIKAAQIRLDDESKAASNQLFGYEVMPVYVKTKNPFMFWRKDHMDALIAGVPAMLDTYRRDKIAKGAWEPFDHPDVQDWLRDNGYDAYFETEFGQLLYEDKDTGDTKTGGQLNLALIGQSEDQQIKSATGNVGSYGQRPVTAEDVANLKITEADQKALGTNVVKVGDPMTPEIANKLQALGDIRFSVATPADTMSFTKAADSERLGSNPGGIYQDAAGNRFYVKFYDDDNQAKSEIAAAKLYRAAGLPSPDLTLGPLQNGLNGLASRWRDDLQELEPAELAAHPDAPAAYYVSAVLKNWDVVGLGYDNLVQTGYGRLMVVDGGGTFKFRAQGGPKAYDGNVQAELDGYLNPYLNPEAARVFSKMFEANPKAKEQGQAAVAKLTDNVIDKAVAEAGLGQDIAEAAKQRRDAVMKFSVGSPEFKTWFGNSKVVDGQGKPLVVYTGTSKDADFTKFKAPKNGVWFTSDREVASQYAMENDSQATKMDYYTGKFIHTNTRGRVIPVYLSLQNPKALDTVPDSLRYASNYKKAQGEYFEQLKTQGYDGVVMPGGVYVAFRPEQIKSSMGNRGTWDGSNPDIRFSINDTLIATGLTQGQFNALHNVGALTIDKTWQDKAESLQKSMFGNFRQKYVDQFDPLKGLDDPAAYMYARLSKASDGALEAFLNYGDIRINGGVYDSIVGGKGLTELMQGLQGEHDRWMWWVAAQRADKLSKDERERLFGTADIRELKLLNQGDLPDGQKRLKVYSDTLKEFQKLNAKVLNVGRDSGLIDANSKQFWEDEFYIPFYRAAEDGIEGSDVGPSTSSGLVRQYAFKKLRGGTGKLNQDLMANILMNWSHILSASAKNRAAKQALESAERMGIAAKAKHGEKGAVWFMDGGKKTSYTIDEEYAPVLDAITAISRAGSDGPGAKAMGKFKHWLTVGVTANPTFKLRNLIRDSIAAMAVSPLGYNPLKNVSDGLDIMRDKQNQTYASLLASGGIIRFGTMLEGDRASHMRKLINAGIPENTIVTSWEHVKDKFTKGLDWYNEWGDTTEGANRAALYQQLREQGVSHAEAAFQARDMLDFSMGGTSGVIRYLTSVVPFMNARIQGLDKLARGAREDSGRFAAVLGATALASLFLLMKYRDDDDWKKREDWDRDNYWWFKVDGRAYRIPKPFEVGAIATLAERTAELYMSDEMTGKQFARFLKDTVLNTFAMNPVPQMFKPVIDVYANENSFTKRAIESEGMEHLQKSERYTGTTSEAARLLGKNGLVSPVQIDHLVKSYAGWLGTAALTIGDLTAKGIMDRPAEADRRLKEMFFVGNFAEELPSASSRYLTQFYKQSREITEAHATFKLLNETDPERAERYAEEKQNELGLYKAANRIQRQLAKLNAQTRAIENSRDMTGAEKREAIDAITEAKNQLAASAERSLASVLD